MLKAPARIKSNDLVLQNAQKCLLFPKLVSIIVRYIPIVSQHIDNRPLHSNSVSTQLRFFIKNIYWQVM